MAAAEDVGYPVMLKAAAGGGGRGIRVVADEAELDSAFPTASREAEGGVRRRADVPGALRAAAPVTSRCRCSATASTCVHLFERECSLQRRRQKVVEEAPAPGIDDASRAEMTAAAVRLCREVGYRSAGTVRVPGRRRVRASSSSSR